MARICTLITIILAVSCGSPESCPAGHVLLPDGGCLRAPDGATPDSGSSPFQCEANADCANGAFCDGAERCVPGDPTADARGCVAGENPCAPNQVCDLAADRCVTNCAMGGDADDDSHAAIECGGDDCDDSDPSRYPGAPEVCDDRDTDCVDSTLAGPDDGDLDGDGFVSSACCAADPSGGPEPVCGGDCDDDAAGINPGSPEACNDIDDDCDGRIDEGLRSVFYRDDDGDLYGRDDDMIEACVRPVGYAVVGGDCDDTSVTINPLGTETCDGADQDCDEVIDEEAEELGTREHCSACGDECQFACGTATCDLPLKVEAGAFHACVLLDSGRVFCWGANADGQLGVGDRVTRSRPVEMPLGGLTADDLAVGADHTCIRASSGAIWCAGDNEHQQIGSELLGYSDTLIRAGQTSPLGGASGTRVTAGRNHTCSLGSLGQMRCWGASRDAGGTVTTDFTPQVVRESNNTELVGTASADAGAFFTCAARASGSVVCWNESGDPPYRAGADLPSIEAASQVTVGGFRGFHACAVSTDGRLWCWGDNGKGQVGAGVFGGSYETPVLLAGSEWEGVAAGAAHTCAWTTAGLGYCWGYNFDGLGDGTREDRNSPTLIAGDHRWRSIAAGYANLSCGITQMNEVFCWGDNDLDSLGIGLPGGRSVPVLVASP